MHGSAFPQCIKRHLHSVLLLEKNFVSRMSTGRRKGRFKAEPQGALPSAIVNLRVAYSFPAFKSFVEDLWPVTKWCSFSGIHCIRDLLLQQGANPGEMNNALYQTSGSIGGSKAQFLLGEICSKQTRHTQVEHRNGSKAFYRKKIKKVQQRNTHTHFCKWKYSSLLVLCFQLDYASLPGKDIHHHELLHDL